MALKVFSIEPLAAAAADGGGLKAGVAPSKARKSTSMWELAVHRFEGEERENSMYQKRDKKIKLNIYRGRREITVLLHLLDQLLGSLIQEEVGQQGVTCRPIGIAHFVNCVLSMGGLFKMKLQMCCRKDQEQTGVSKPLTGSVCKPCKYVFRYCK